MNNQVLVILSNLKGETLNVIEYQDNDISDLNNRCKHYNKKAMAKGEHTRIYTKVVYN